MVLINVTTEEWEQHRAHYDGLCLACGEWTTGGVEPDARNYKCDLCDERRVYGAEEILFSPHVTVDGEAAL